MRNALFSETLIEWYQRHKRPLPWRKTDDPYKIWLSEIILQQTRVAQGTPYYHRFVEEFPSVYHLAQAEEDLVLKLWEGLGYYNRARNMQIAARQVVERFDGNFPENYAGLLQLKGVGEYTAAAISSFAFNEVQAVVDGNVFRVLARYFGVETPINSAAGKKEFAALANELIDTEDPATHNQALMEFGALHCVPKSPDCKNCPLAGNCYAFTHHLVQELPVKIRKKYNRERYFNFALVQMPGGEVLVQRRGEGDVWRKLYQFPLVEHSRWLQVDELLQELQVIADSHRLEISAIEDLKPHKLSHQTIHCRIFFMKWKDPATRPWVGSAEMVPFQQLQELAFPRPLRKYLDGKQLTLQIGIENF